MEGLEDHFDISRLSKLAAIFVYNQVNPSQPLDAHEVAPSGYSIDSPVSVLPSAVSTFYVPSDLSGIGGMHRERIRTTNSWISGPPRYDCVLVSKDSPLPGFQGLHVARVRLFLAFKFCAKQYSTALVEWYTPVGSEPDDLTGLWIIEPDFNRDGSRTCEIITLDSIMR